MNIQCQQCGTSYAVADEKVRGRLMKVRCKSCSEVIRVDGTVLGAADGSSAPPQLKPGMSKPPSPSSRPDVVEDAVWHVAIGDGTQGPYTLDELREHYAQGSVARDTLVYRDGFDEWREAGDVPELAAPAQARSHVHTGALAFGGGVSMGSDPFGERRAQAAGESPRVSASELLDENVSREHTVQFSLDQIRALSSVSQAAPVQTSTSLPALAASSRAGVVSTLPGGYASGDGSGLIDVRKLAELHRTMTEQEPASARDESSSLLPAQGSYAHTLAPLSLPLPAAAPSQGIDSKTKLIAGLAAFGMVLAAAVGVLALTRPQPALEPSIAAAAQPLAPEPEATAAVQDDEAAKAEAPEAEAQAAAPAAEEADDDDEATAARSNGKRGKRGKAAKAAAKSEGEPVAKASKEKPAAPAAKDSIDDLLSDAPKAKKASSSAGASIDDLLDSAVSGKKAPAPKAEAKPASNLPTTPGRDEMLAALGKAKTKAAKCKGTGVATAQIQIAGSTGKATNVNVTGADGAAAACVEKAVRSTAFPKFQKDSFEVKFPFKLGG